MSETNAAGIPLELEEKLLADTEFPPDEIEVSQEPVDLGVGNELIGQEVVE